MVSISKRVTALFAVLLMFSIVILPSSVLAKTQEASSVVSGGFITSYTASKEGVPLDKQVATVREVTAQSGCVQTVNNVTTSCPEGTVFSVYYMSEQRAKAARLPYVPMTTDAAKFEVAIYRLANQVMAQYTPVSNKQGIKPVIKPMANRGCGNNQNYNNAFVTSWYAHVRWAIGFNVYGTGCSSMQIISSYAGFDNNGISNPYTYWGGIDTDLYGDPNVCLSIPRNDSGLSTLASNNSSGFVEAIFKQDCGFGAAHSFQKIPTSAFG